MLNIGTRRWLLGTAALTLAAATPAFAGDLPASDAGSRTIADFVGAYLGKAALPSIKISSQGLSYLVSFDLGAATAALKPTGFTYDPAEVKFRVFQQDDGAWRIEQNGIPPLTGHMKLPQGKGGGKIDGRFELANLNSTMVLDPKIGWLASSKGAADKFTIVESGPGIEEFIELTQLKFDAATKSSGAGLTTTINEPIAAVNIVVDVDPKKADADAKGPAKPVHISAKGEDGSAKIVLKDFQPAPLLDAWRFLTAHPERADYAKDVEGLKSVVNAVIADRLTISEDFSMAKLTFNTEGGPVAIEGGTGGVGIVSNGADSGFSEHVSARALKLPDGLIAPMYAAVIPTSFDIAFQATGFDIASASQEWFADAKLDGDGPVLSEEDRAKVSEKLTQSRPIVVDIKPSHIAAPSLDIALEGKVIIDKGKPSGTVTIRVRDFDKTAQAVQALGQEAQQKLVPMIAMAKGLGKQNPDGTMVWVGELGRDRVRKINGLPLGKSPM
jgi:hypothetical protein